jgi:alkanesulfonate monooxygenase SsuD/methylene tetrahydromethanopterin reductase-like flavin-dependent oxidoreductase (luciferase family)
VRVGLVILPADRWREARRMWEWAEDAGFHSAWTYDHIRWGGMPEGPWHSAVPVLAAAGAVTRRIRLGTLVATPNFRHPVTLAREAIALDDVTEGRLDLGLGAGSPGPDATALGQQPWTPAQRMIRFEEFLRVLTPILNGSDGTRTSLRTASYTADEAPSTPGTVQRPLPLTIGAGGPKGLRLAAAYGRSWVTVGPTSGEARTSETVRAAINRQLPLLETACRAVGREPADIGKTLLWMPTEPQITSADQFDELAAPYAALGFELFVLHHPAQTGPFGGDIRAFEQIAGRHAGH